MKDSINILMICVTVMFVIANLNIKGITDNSSVNFRIKDGGSDIELNSIKNKQN